MVNARVPRQFNGERTDFSTTGTGISEYSLQKTEARSLPHTLQKKLTQNGPNLTVKLQNS